MTVAGPGSHPAGSKRGAFRALSFAGEITDCAPRTGKTKLPRFFVFFFPPFSFPVLSRHVLRFCCVSSCRRSNSASKNLAGQKHRKEPTGSSAIDTETSIAFFLESRLIFFLNSSSLLSTRGHCWHLFLIGYFLPNRTVQSHFHASVKSPGDAPTRDGADESERQTHRGFLCAALGSLNPLSLTSCLAVTGYIS